MKLSDFDFDYPLELLAEFPLGERAASKMMVLNRKNNTIEHSYIKNLGSFLNKGDLLILNDTKVFPARLIGKKSTGGRIEILLLEQTSAKPPCWKCITDQTARLKIGATLSFDGGLTAEVIKRDGDSLLVDINRPELIEKFGHVPIPPYIRNKRLKHRKEDKNLDRTRYQTIFAKNAGSAAAPTAGLHFTRKLLNDLKKKGIEIATVTLHVGLDTFSPVRVDKITEHKMHGEEYIVPKNTIKKILSTKKAGGKIVAVGTTCVRALESHFQNAWLVNAPKNGPLRSELFIYPGYNFKIVDAMLTNFHQPKSTLIMMASAFAGKDFIFDSYREAFGKKYRLFSYGDCMLIL